MIIDFRQGIISAQTNNSFLELVSGKVNINVDIAHVNLAFAYATHDYLFTESEQIIGAWSSFPSNKTIYLYWDIDIITGVRTFGTTAIAPSFGDLLPNNPLTDQHYFDYNDKKMKVWSGTQWIEKIRVFAGYVQNNAILVPNALGTQVGLNSQVALGYILFNSNNQPLRVADSNNRYYFLTTEDQVHTQQDIYNAYKIDSLLMDGKALEPIPAYSCITWKGAKQLGVASYIDYTRPCIGIAVESFGTNETKRFVTKGFLTNYNFWNWTEAPNTPLWVGSTGQITTVVPQQWSIQKIGHIVSPDTIFIDIEDQILIQTDITIPSPSISSSSTPTPTPTPSITSTNAPTPTSSSTINPTPTPSITPSQIPQVTYRYKDYISIFYKNDSATTSITPAPISISTYNGAIRTDIGQALPSWGTDGNGEIIGDKFTRKLSYHNLYSDFYVYVNSPDTPNTTTAANTSAILKTGGYMIRDGQCTNLAWETTSNTIITVEPSQLIYSYASSLLSPYTIGLLTDTSYNITGFTYTVNGQSFNPTYTLPTLQSYAMSGLGIMPSKSYGEVVSNTNGGTSTFALGFNTNILTLTWIIPYSVGFNSYALDFSITANVPNTPASILPATIPAGYYPEIYESKYSSNLSMYIISMVNAVASNRQSMTALTDIPESKNPYLLLLDSTGTQMNIISGNGDLSYYTVTDDYVFSIRNTSGTYGAELLVYQINPSTPSLTLITSIPISDPNKFNFLPYDARLRSSQSAPNIITIYTFGFGIYKFYINTSSLVNTGISDIYNDMQMLNVTSTYHNYIIDTWVGTPICTAGV